MNERRRSKRMELKVEVKLYEVKSEPGQIARELPIPVEVINISKDGIAFLSTEEIPLNRFFKASISLWTKERLDSVIEVLRIEPAEDSKTMYGCRFVGIDPSDQLKIQIYDMFQ